MWRSIDVDDANPSCIVRLRNLGLEAVAELLHLFTPPINPLLPAASTGALNVAPNPGP